MAESNLDWWNLAVSHFENEDFEFAIFCFMQCLPATRLPLAAS